MHYNHIKGDELKMDFSEIDALLNRADAYNKPQFAPEYTAYYNAIASIKFPYVKECADFMGGIDPFSEAYIHKMRLLHEKIIRTDSRYGYSFDLEGDSDYQTNEVGLWKYNMRRVGEFLQAVGILASKLALGENVTVLEPGCGIGYLTEMLVKIGCKVDAVDVNEKYCQVARDRIQFATRMEDAASIYHMDIESYLDNCDKKYDVVLFFESFHHLMNHYRILEKIVKRNLSTNGKIVLAAEPVYSDSDVNEALLPFEWGVRFDGESLNVMRRFGWLELGFKERYIKTLGERLGLSITKMTCKESVYAKKIYILAKSDQPSFKFVIDKEDMILKCAQNLINRFSRRNELSNLFIEYGYKTICIYGYGRLGKLVYNVLLESEVKVAIIIDRRAAMMEEDVPCPIFAHIGLCKEELNDCDAILVTAIADFDDVKDDLHKHSNLPIISLDVWLDK